MKTPNLPPFLDEAITEHLKMLHQQIVDRAQELALQDAKRSDAGRGAAAGVVPDITPVQCLRAIEEIAPGTSLPARQESHMSFWETFLESVSPVTLICALLTIAFAAFGLVIIHKEGKGEINPTAYLDISKIFAGAIVGSASAAAIHASRGDRGPR